MFEISSEIYFSAAHHLKNYNGPCEKIHGHNWRVVAYIRSKELNEIGIGIDFKTLKSLLAEVVKKLDHSDLNTIFDKNGQNPSSENIARHIYKELEQRLTVPYCFVSRVDVYETPGNCASYFNHD
jgi:6-pyruvoyltetrahydropterin/6-carboxytetrahydropterin synthase